jgi:hypothetical protein
MLNRKINPGGVALIQIRARSSDRLRMAHLNVHGSPRQGGTSSHDSDRSGMMTSLRPRCSEGRPAAAQRRCRLREHVREYLRFAPEEQIIGVLKQVEAGRTVKEVARELGVSEATIYTWKSKYGAMEVTRLAVRGVSPQGSISSSSSSPETH